MPISIQISPPMPTRPCRFCLSFQGDSVFADFDIDETRQMFLLRISFDGYGRCRKPILNRIWECFNAPLTRFADLDQVLLRDVVQAFDFAGQGAGAPGLAGDVDHLL